MALRREIMNYLGTGAIGGIVGYYVGAQGLLGIQSEEVVRRPPEDEDQPPEDEDGSDDSDMETVVTERFEDSDLTQWNGIESAETTTQTVFEGDKSLIITDQHQGEIVGNTITRPFDPVAPSKLSGALLIGSGGYNTANIAWKNDNDNTVHKIQIRNYDDQIEYNRPNALSSTEPNTWYYCELAQIDWEAEQIGEIRINNSVVGTDVPFLNSSQQVSSVSLKVHDGGTGSTGHFDEITVGR